MPVGKSLRAGATRDARPTVLLVDDEPDLREAFSGLLEEFLHLRVVTAPDAESALRMMDTLHVDAVLSDFKMPGMDGLELLSRLKRAHPDVAVLLVTAYADDELERRTERLLGPGSLLSKSEEPEFMLRRIQRAVGPAAGSRDPGRGRPPDSPGAQAAASLQRSSGLLRRQ